jgi:hypothetical protein
MSLLQEQLEETGMGRFDDLIERSKARREETLADAMRPRTPVARSFESSDAVVGDAAPAILGNMSAVETDQTQTDFDIFDRIDQAELIAQTWLASEKAKLSSVQSPQARAIREARLLEQASKVSMLIDAKRVEFAYSEGSKLDPEQRRTMNYLLSNGISGRDAVMGAQDHHSAMSLLSELKMMGEEGQSVANALLTQGDQIGAISLDPETGVYSINNRNAFAIAARKYSNIIGSTEKGQSTVAQRTVEAESMFDADSSMRRGGSRFSGEAGSLAGAGRGLKEAANTYADIVKMKENVDMLPNETLKRQARQELDNYILDTVGTDNRVAMDSINSRVAPIVEKYTDLLKSPNDADRLNIPKAEREVIFRDNFEIELLKHRENKGVAGLERGARVDTIVESINTLTRGENSIDARDAEKMLSDFEMKKGSDFVFVKAGEQESLKKQLKAFVRGEDPDFLDRVIVQQNDKKVSVASTGSVFAAEFAAKYGGFDSLLAGESGKAANKKTMGERAGNAAHWVFRNLMVGEDGLPLPLPRNAISGVGKGLAWLGEGATSLAHDAGFHGAGFAENFSSGFAKSMVGEATSPKRLAQSLEEDDAIIPRRK